MKNRLHFDIRKLCLALALILTSVAYAQNKTVTGTIVDSNQEPIIGATVVEVGASNNGAISDIDGNFSISGLKPSSKLQVSFIGYETQVITVGNQTKLKIVLKDDAQALEEVVVVGYGTMRKTDLTGSIASVSSDKIAKRGSLRVEDALQGAVPGVNITQSSSRANSGFDIQIRGQASINNAAQPLYVVDGVVVSSIDYLNPEDIARIDVLKDASSTAIYGSRASSGVILIATKGTGNSAKAQPIEISYDGYYGVRKVARMPDFMDTQQFMDYRLARYTESVAASDGSGRAVVTLTDANRGSAWQTGAADWKSGVLYERYMDNKTYDWENTALRTASQQNHFISASGATEKTNFRLGIGYQSEENVFRHNDYERFNIKGAFESKLNKYVEVGLSVNLAHDTQKDFTTDGSNTYSPYNNAFWFAPCLDPYDEEGNLYTQPGKVPALGLSLTSTPSPIIDFEMENAYDNTTRKFHAFGNVFLRFNIMDNLKFTTTFSPNFYHGRQGIFFGTGVSEKYPNGSSYYQSKKQNYAEVVNTDRLDWTWDNQIDYNQTWGDHSLTAMGLFSLYASNRETYSQSVTGISDDKLLYFAMNKGSQNQTVGSSYTESSLVSAATRLNYVYKDRYMATVTLRADGSSRFAKDNRWGWFPSAAVAWRMNQEDFLKDVSWLDNLKLRLSYGVTGNNNVGDYATASSASGPNYAVIGGNEVLGYYPNGLIDTGLLWEKVKEFDFGVDFSALNNRVNLTADYYVRNSDGQIMKSTVPVESGETSITTNIGSVRNKGIELALNLGVIRNEEFQWDLSLNYARNKSEITELPMGDDINNAWFIGERLNVLYDYTPAGVITEDGVTMKTKDGNVHYSLQEVWNTFGQGEGGQGLNWFEGQLAVNDWNNDKKINDEDRHVYACTDPTWTGSLISSMYWKGFDFSFNIYTKQGQWSRSYFHSQYMQYSDRGRQKLNFDYYLPAGTPVIDKATGEEVLLTEARVGAFPYPNNKDKTAGGYIGNAVDYQKTSFVKVKNICLGYTFPKQWIGKLGVKHLRVYANILNPFVFTDYEGFDPEWASASLVNGGPASVTYQFGVNLKF
ncbi:MAG: TonB-dependent receptor [Bacteroides sp.]|nr:TonB-dependent receptor [Bacteroides sp.]